MRKHIYPFLFRFLTKTVRRILSFPPIPDARYFTAPEPVFWPAILELVLSGYRIQ